MGDGTEAYPGDLDDAIDAVREAGYVVVSPRRNPDQRVLEAIQQIDINIGLWKAAMNCGGRAPRKGIVSALKYKLSELDDESVLTPMEMEAAAND